MVEKHSIRVAGREWHLVNDRQAVTQHHRRRGYRDSNVQFVKKKKKMLTNACPPIESIKKGRPNTDVNGRRTVSGSVCQWDQIQDNLHSSQWRIFFLLPVVGCSDPKQHLTDQYNLCNWLCFTLTDWSLHIPVKNRRRLLIGLPSVWKLMRANLESVGNLSLLLSAGWSGERFYYMMILISEVNT